MLYGAITDGGGGGLEGQSFPFTCKSIVKPPTRGFRIYQPVHSTAVAYTVWLRFRFCLLYRSGSKFLHISIPEGDGMQSEVPENAVKSTAKNTGFSKG